MLLTPLAQQHAAGARPEGAPLTGTLQPGQVLQQAVQLAPGGSKCYTAIAVGAPTLTALTIQLVLTPPAPLPPTVLSQSQSPANPAVMAGSPNCFKNIAPIPASANLTVTAQGGSGPVMVQLYAK